jgi:hypothetical protein
MPSYGNPEILDEISVWRTFSEKKRHHISICLEDIYVSNDDLEFFKSEYPIKPPVDTNYLESITYNSTRLYHLVRVAKKVWENKADFPTNKEIAAELTGNGKFGFTKNKAKLGAIIISDFKNNKSTQSPQNNGQENYMTDSLLALIEATRHFYEFIDLKNRKAYPKPGIITRWLMKEKGFPEYLALVSPSLICPDEDEIEESKPEFASSKA